MANNPMNKYPLFFWHCRIRSPVTRLHKTSWDAERTDISLDVLTTEITEPWLSQRTFYIKGYRVNPAEDHIEIIQTPLLAQVEQAKIDSKRVARVDNDSLWDRLKDKIDPTINPQYVSDRYSPFGSQDALDYTNDLLNDDRIHILSKELQDNSALSRSDLRHLLKDIRINDADFDALCLDYFPEIYREFTSTMNRQIKINLLLSKGDLGSILQHLYESHPFLRTKQ